jgi:CDP-glucose 4,6-dehydratase
VEDLVSTGFWAARPVLVTGATGLLGGSVVRILHGAGAQIVCLVRDWIPQSEIVRAGLFDRVRVVRGDVQTETQ